MGKLFSKCVCSSDESRSPTPNPRIDATIAEFKRKEEAAEAEVDVQSFALPRLFPADQEKPHKRTSSASSLRPVARKPTKAEARALANAVLDACFLEHSTEHGSDEGDDSGSEAGQRQFNQGVK